MFNKRESSESDATSPSDSRPQAPAGESRAGATAPAQNRSAAKGAAIIGPSISIDGTLKGEEDLVVEGRIKGTLELKSHTLTVGNQGTLNAEVYAQTIFVDGTVNGDLYASEQISIRKSARIKGNMLAPRISLEDGAKFRGSIDMDADSEAFRKAFGTKSTTGSGIADSAPSTERESTKPHSSSGAGAKTGSNRPPEASGPKSAKADTSAA